MVPTSQTRSLPGTQTFVSIDLETTGLDPQKDKIIEVGAVKFSGDVEIGRFSSLVNPGRRLSEFITSLTGISQDDVDGAPRWNKVSPDLAQFLGDSPVVAHNAGFDTGFLRANGVYPRGPVFDTLDLAWVVLPSEPSYGLGRLAQKISASHDTPHRALSDALVTRDLFLYLSRRLGEFDMPVLAQLQRMSEESGWPVGVLASLAIAERPRRPGDEAFVPTGLDPRELIERLQTPRRQRTSELQICRSDFLEAVEEIFAPDGPLKSALPAFEERSEQLTMAKSVAEAIADGENLVVEAGTGVGKSIAYLAGAALHASQGGRPIIVSTNTINLQAQLLQKDAPVVEQTLSTAGHLEESELEISELKGRGNYLCYRRWAHAIQSGRSSEQETSLLGKCLVWLQDTETGDRSELGLGRQTPAFGRISAQGAAECPPGRGPCFLRKARNRAFGADILIINHALLMSNAAMEGGLLPPHDALIVDEAQHLVSAATNHLGFSLSQQQFQAELARLSGERGLIAELSNALQGEGANVEALNPVPVEAGHASEAASRVSTQATAFFEVLQSTYKAFTGDEYAQRLRITSGLRAQPIWAGLEVAWENFDVTLSVLIERFSVLARRGNEASSESEDLSATMLDVTAALDELHAARSGLRQCIPHPDDGMVYWISSRPRDESLFLNGAPLDVGPILREKLFEHERSVVLTGATLGYEGNADRFRQMVGIDGGKDLFMGSPFDYKRAALVAVPEDMPEPGRQGYAATVADAIEDIATKLRDRVLVLFTSNSALESARRLLSPRLEAAGIRLISQGADGPPHRVMSELAVDKEAVALGTSSLWEGVDLEGASIKALVMTRLPFPVPTDPVVEARSELYEDGFGEYMVPEAVVRFRQGFGRLIRSGTDRGAFVILDRRVISRGYGRKFQRALPQCTVKRTSVSRVGELVAAWNGSSAA